jgi:CRP/FNR family transcriptional regulator
MSRREIGSYLGLTLETVSRVFSRFQRDGLVRAELKAVELKDLERLRAMVGVAATQAA